MKSPFAYKTFRMMLTCIACIISAFLPGAKTVAQHTTANAGKLKLFEGEWTLKDNAWKSSTNGVYKEDVNPNRTFVASAVSPENTILWEQDFDNGAWATLLWTYHKKTGRVNYISNTADNNVGIGAGSFDNNNDLTIKITYPNGCTSCHRIYAFHWIEEGVFDFKATIFKDGKPTGDFYGGTFVKKAGKKENKSSVRSVQIGVNVADTSRSLDFYTTLFGMKRVSDWHASSEMAAAAGVNSGKAFDLIDMSLDCNGYVLQYKLNQTQNNSGTISTRAFPYYGFEKHGLGYLTFSVENIDPYLDTILKKKIDYKLVTLPDGHRVILLHDPDGALLEIMGK